MTVSSGGSPVTPRDPPVTKSTRGPPRDPPRPPRDNQDFGELDIGIITNISTIAHIAISTSTIIIIYTFLLAMFLLLLLLVLLLLL